MGWIRKHHLTSTWEIVPTKLIKSLKYHSQTTILLLCLWRRIRFRNYVRFIGEFYRSRRNSLVRVRRSKMMRVKLRRRVRMETILIIVKYSY